MLSILKIVSPKQLSLARCYQSNNFFSLTRTVAFAAHPVLSVGCCLDHSGSLRSPSVTVLTQAAFAYPVLSILKIVSPKQLSLARCYQSNAFSLTQVAYAHPVLQFCDRSAAAASTSSRSLLKRFTYSGHHYLLGLFRPVTLPSQHQTYVTLALDLNTRR